MKLGSNPVIHDMVITYLSKLDRLSIPSFANRYKEAYIEFDKYMDEYNIELENGELPTSYREFHGLDG